MKQVKLLISVTLLSLFLIVGSAFAGSEGAVDATKKSTEKGTMKRPTSAVDTQTQDFQRVSELMDSSVKGTNGEDLGSVEDVILSSDGQARYIVLSKGGVGGVGGELIPVPFDVAQPTRGAAGDITLNIDQQRIDQAPTIAENELENAAAWEKEVRGYFKEKKEK